MSYAKGKEAWGLCDICGFRYLQRELTFNSYGLLVCSYDFDGDYDRVNHPQNYQPPFSEDPQGLEDPRPDRVEPSITSLWEPDDSSPP